jgi:hypothetical protein
MTADGDAEVRGHAAYLGDNADRSGVECFTMAIIIHDLASESCDMSRSCY